MSAPPTLPELVHSAQRLSHRLGFVRSCRNETGRLLATLAASRTGVLAEAGTGCGVGSAWLRSGMRAGSSLVTAELDASRYESARQIFDGDSAVTVIEADWKELGEYAPFSLFFVDGGGAKSSPDGVAELMAPGGLVVLDDFTPYDGWPPMYDGRVDTLRQNWLTDPRFTTVEVMVAVDASVLLATLN